MFELKSEQEVAAMPREELEVNMAYYRTCPHCNAALDPGEMCDCFDARFYRLSPENQQRVNRAILDLIAKQNAGREFARPSA